MANNRDHLADDLAGDALSLVVPFGNTLGARMWRAVRQEWARNTSKALRAAETASGLKREDLEEWLETDPRAVPLYMKVLWAAGMNGHDETLQALGLVLGHAARAADRGDDEGLADAELALHAMADMGPRHFKVLATLAEGVILNGNYSQFAPGYVAQQCGLRPSVAHQCMVHLAGAGLAETVSVLESMAYPITDLGRAVLAAAEAASDGKR